MTERFTASSPADDKDTEVVQTRPLEGLVTDREQTLERIDTPWFGRRIANFAIAKWNARQEKKAARAAVTAPEVPDTSSDAEDVAVETTTAGRHMHVAGVNDEHLQVVESSTAKHRKTGAHRGDLGLHRGENFDETADTTVEYLFSPTNPHHISLYSHAHEAKEYTVDELLVMLNDPTRDTERDEDLHALYKSRKTLNEVNASKVPSYHESVKKAHRAFNEEKDMYNAMYGIDTENIQEASPLDQLTYARSEFARAAYDNRKGRFFFGRKDRNAQYEAARETYNSARENYYAELLDRYEDSMSEEEKNQFVLTFSEKEQQALVHTEVEYFATQGKRKRALRKLRNRLNTMTDSDRDVRREAIDDATAGNQKAQGRDEIRQQIWEQNDMWHDKAHESKRKSTRLKKYLGGAATLAAAGAAIYVFRHDAADIINSVRGTGAKDAIHPAVNGAPDTTIHPGLNGSASGSDTIHPGLNGGSAASDATIHPALNK